MNREVLQLISACGLLAAGSVACAQDAFPDAPANHWAYDSLARLKREGILAGYPDGLYRGARPASRYEIAAAVHSAYIALKARADGLSGQVKLLSDRLESGQGMSQEDLANLRAALAAAQGDLNGTKGWTVDLADLKELALTFEKELTAMGVNVEAMKDDLSKLDSRVTLLEKRKLPIDLSGDLNVVGLGGYSSSSTFGITVDGRPTGVGRGSYAGGSLDSTAKVGANRDLTILQETAVSMASTNTQGAKFRGTVVAGDHTGLGAVSNSLGSQAFGDQSRVYPGSPFAEANTSVYLQDLSIQFDSAVAGIPFNAEVGRVGYVIDPYIFKRPDNTPYFQNGRRDSGQWNFDGAIVTFDYGATKLHFFGGRNNLASGGSVNGTPLQPMQSGSASGPFTIDVNRPRGFTPNLLTIQESLGANLNIPLTQAGTLNLAYLWLSSDSTVPIASSPANSVRVYGANVKLQASKMSVEGGYSKSDLMSNNKTLVDQDNDAYWVNVNKEWDRYGAKAGYKYIAPQFSAPGDWGRIGIWWNPTDIKGFTGDVHYDLNAALKLTAGGEFYTGSGTPSSTLTTDDKVQRYVIGLTYAKDRRYDFSLGYEEARWDLANRSSASFTGGTPTERWYNLGFGMNLSSAARLKSMWQISDYDSKGVSGFSPFANSSTTTAKGGLITTQLSVKF